MHSEFSEETQSRITGLCSTISVANHLNDKIREELHSHIVDKMEAYLTGSEVLTEDDAFVLVREHFGNPEIISSMYEIAEPVAAYGSIMRRFGAAVVATILLFTLGSYVLEICMASLARMTPNTIVPEAIIFGIPKIASHLTGLLLFAAVLYHWRVKMLNGEQPWFITIKPYWFIGITVVSLIFTYLIIVSTLELQAQSNISAYVWLGSIIFHCILWIWWMDNNSNHIFNIFIGLLSWMLAQYIILNGIAILSAIPTNPSDITTNQILKLLSIFRYYPTHLNVPGAIAITIYLLMFGVQSARRKIQSSLVQ